MPGSSRRVKVSKRLVVDASILRAAGGEQATFPLSKTCRDVLLAILEVCHHAVLNRMIGEKWRKHCSRFARTWRVSMEARKKIHRLDETAETGLRSLLTQAIQNPRQRDAALKDAHLVEAAIDADHIVLSLDDTVRGILSSVTSHIGILRNVMWANPGNPAEGAKEWLEAGAGQEACRLLHEWSS